MDLDGSMFTKLYALDPGSYAFRLNDVYGEKWSECRSCYGVYEGQIEAIGSQAIQYEHMDYKHRLQYIMEDGKLVQDPSPLLQKMIDELRPQTHLFRPSFVVALPKNADKNQWKKILNDLGARQIRFVSTLDVLSKEEYNFEIHVGHSQTQMALYKKGILQFHKTFSIAGRRMDEAIQEKIGQMKNCFISLEDANQLKHAISDILWQNKNATLTCWGMNRYQKYEKIEIKAFELWPCMEEVERQIVEQAWACFQEMGMITRQKVCRNRVRLSGGMSACFGLRQMLEAELYCPIICNEEASYDIISAIKE